MAFARLDKLLSWPMRRAPDPDRAIAEGEQRYRAGAFADAQKIFTALAARHPEDREAYTEAKAPFIRRVESEPLALLRV